MKKTPSKNSQPSKKASMPPLLNGLSKAAGKAFSGHKSDILGLAFLVIGLLSTLGLYFDLAGVVGKILGPWIFLSCFGSVGYAAPVSLIIAGLALSFYSPKNETEAEDDSALPARILIGGLFIFASICGLAHFYDNAANYDLSDFAELKKRGGVLGYLTGTPLRAAFEQLGASLVLVAVGLFGVIVATGVTFREAGGKVWRFLKAVGGIISKSIRLVLGESKDEIGGFRDELSQPKIQIDGESRNIGVPVQDDAPDSPEENEANSHAEDKKETDSTDDDATTEPEKVRKGFKKAGLLETGEQLEIELGPGAKGSPWKLPSIKVLDRSTTRDVNEALVEERGRVLERALATHGVETRLVGMVVGPTVTRYELELAPGVKVSKVTALNKDIAYAMASPDVRILAPIPGRQAIGVEVPNNERQVVALGDILSAPEARKATQTQKDISNIHRYMTTVIAS